MTPATTVSTPALGPTSGKAVLGLMFY
jgi:hypothetical protein